MLFGFRPAGPALVLDHLVYGIPGKAPMDNGQADWGCSERMDTSPGLVSLEEVMSELEPVAEL